MFGVKQFSVKPFKHYYARAKHFFFILDVAVFYKH